MRQHYFEVIIFHTEVVKEESKTIRNVAMLL